MRPVILHSPFGVKDAIRGGSVGTGRDLSLRAVAEMTNNTVFARRGGSRTGRQPRGGVVTTIPSCRNFIYQGFFNSPTLRLRLVSRRACRVHWESLLRRVVWQDGESGLAALVRSFHFALLVSWLALTLGVWWVATNSFDTFDAGKNPVASKLFEPASTTKLKGRMAAREVNTRIFQAWNRCNSSSASCCFTSSGGRGR